MTQMTATDADPLLNFTTNFTAYDANNELQSATHTNQANESFAFDANGNQTQGGRVTGAGNRLTSDGTFNFTFDGEGNLTKQVRISTADATDYETDCTWDDRDRLTKVTIKNISNGNIGTIISTVNYTYDYMNRRIARDTGSAIGRQYFVYDGRQLYLEATNGATGLYLSHRYLNGPAVDEVLASDDCAGHVNWGLGDNEGTIRDVVQYNSGTGQTTVLDHRTYNSFGLMTPSNTAIDYIFGWTGSVYDPATKLNELGLRWYNPLESLWISADPSGFTYGVNGYEYADNNPPVNVDFTGEGASRTLASTYASVSAPATSILSDLWSGVSSSIDQFATVASAVGSTTWTQVSAYASSSGLISQINTIADATSNLAIGAAQSFLNDAYRSQGSLLDWIGPRDQAIPQAIAVAKWMYQDAQNEALASSIEDPFYAAAYYYRRPAGYMGYWGDGSGTPSGNGGKNLAGALLDAVNPVAIGRDLGNRIGDGFTDPGPSLEGYSANLRKMYDDAANPKSTNGRDWYVGEYQGVVSGSLRESVQSAGKRADAYVASAELAADVYMVVDGGLALRQLARSPSALLESPFATAARGNNFIGVPQVNAAASELVLRRAVAQIDGEVILDAGGAVTTNGYDILSYNTNTRRVTMWDSKFRSNPTRIQPSATFNGQPYRNAMIDAIDAVQNSSLSTSQKAAAFRSLRSVQGPRRITVGAGPGARNSVIQWRN